MQKQFFQMLDVHYFIKVQFKVVSAFESNISQEKINFVICYEKTQISNLLKRKAFDFTVIKIRCGFPCWYRLKFVSRVFKNKNN